MNKDMLSIEETADMLSVHPRTIRRYLKSGVVQGVKVGGKWHIKREEIRKMLGREDVAGQLEESWSRQAVEYIQGAPSPIGSRYRVCAITDCDFANDEEAKCASQALLGIINGREPAAPEARFQYRYNAGERRGRFILWGDPAFIAQCMDELATHMTKGDNEQ